MKGKINPVSLLKDKIGLNENRALMNTSGIVTFLNLYSYYLYRKNVEDYRGYDLIFVMEFFCKNGFPYRIETETSEL